MINLENYDFGEESDEITIVFKNIFWWDVMRPNESFHLWVAAFIFLSWIFLLSNHFCYFLLQALQSLSLADSRLRQRGMVLVNALGSNACLRKVDLSGNLLEDSGAKMLSKALQINTTLRCVCARVSFENQYSDGSEDGFPCRLEEKQRRF